MFLFLIWIKPYRGFKDMGWMGGEMGLKWVLNVRLNEGVLHHLENKWVLRRKLQRNKKSSFWDGPDPPYFLTKTHNDPNWGEIRGGFGWFFTSFAKIITLDLQKMKGLSLGPGLRETICNEHTITDYLLAINRITSPFSRYYAHYYACRPKVK